MSAADVHLAATERIRSLLDPGAGGGRSPEGYLDLLGPSAEPEPTLAQLAMRSTLLPQIYERVWRPIGFGIAKGRPLGPSTAEEYALARDRLGLGGAGLRERREPVAATVLDVACGPGNVTRALGEGVRADGLVVGLDASRTMLAQAVTGTGVPHIGYVAGDAVRLPFRDDSFDAVCCYGALYLFDEPWVALDGMARVLKPGGRIVILTSRRPVLPVSRIAAEVTGRMTGVRLFGRRELAQALTDRGFGEIRQRVHPLMQYISGQLV